MEKKGASSAKPSKGKRTDTSLVEVDVHIGQEPHLSNVMTKDPPISRPTIFPVPLIQHGTLPSEVAGPSKEDPPISRLTNIPVPLTQHGTLPSEVAGPSKAIHTETTFVEVDRRTGRAHLIGTTVTKEIPSVSPQPSSSSITSAVTGLSEEASTSRLRDEPGILDVIGIISSSENSSAENTGGTVKEIADKASVRSESPLQHWSPPHKTSSRPPPEGEDDFNVIERLPTPPPEESRPLRRTPSPLIPPYNRLMEFWLERIMVPLNMGLRCYVILMVLAIVVLLIATGLLAGLALEHPAGYAFMITFATIAIVTSILLVAILITNCCYKEELMKRSSGSRLRTRRDHLE